MKTQTVQLLKAECKPEHQRKEGRCNTTHLAHLKGFQPLAELSLVRAACRALQAGKSLLQLFLGGAAVLSTHFRSKSATSEIQVNSRRQATLPASGQNKIDAVCSRGQKKTTRTEGARATLNSGAAIKQTTKQKRTQQQLQDPRIPLAERAHLRSRVCATAATSGMKNLGMLLAFAHGLFVH